MIITRHVTAFCDLINKSQKTATGRKEFLPSKTPPAAAVDEYRRWLMFMLFMLLCCRHNILTIKNVVIGVTIKNVVICATIKNVVIDVTIQNVVIGVTIKNVVIGATIKKMW